MQRTRVQDQEESLEREKQTKYKGSARIRLEHLDFSKGEPNVPDRSNVKNLVSIFDNAQTERPELQLPSGFLLKCLHGRHRVQAGREMTLPQLWWTVDLYQAGMID